MGGSNIAYETNATTANSISIPNTSNTSKSTISSPTNTLNSKIVLQETPKDKIEKAALVEFLTEENEDEEEGQWNKHEGDDEEEEEDIIPVTSLAIGSDAEKKSIEKSARSSSADERVKKFKFGIQPDSIVSVNDFGVEPELLTTAQKVAILESSAFQNKSTAVRPTLYKANSIRPLSMNGIGILPKNSSNSMEQNSADYVPTGKSWKHNIRRKDEIDR